MRIRSALPAPSKALTMAYDTLGMVDISRNDYASAVSSLQKAIEQDKNNPEAVLYLRLSVAQDKLKQYPQALDSANKAVQYAQEGTPAQNLAKQQQQRLQRYRSTLDRRAGPQRQRRWGRLHQPPRELCPARSRIRQCPERESHAKLRAASLLTAVVSSSRQMPSASNTAAPSRERLATPFATPNCSAKP